jgi:hypothetical protein
MQRRIRITIQILITGFPSGDSRHALRDVQFAIRPKLASSGEGSTLRRVDGEGDSSKPGLRASCISAIGNTGENSEVRSIKPIW